MEPFDSIPLNDIDEEVMTDLEKETIKDEYLYDEVLEEDNDNSQK